MMGDSLCPKPSEHYVQKDWRVRRLGRKSSVEEAGFALGLEER